MSHLLRSLAAAATLLATCACAPTGTSTTSERAASAIGPTSSEVNPAPTRSFPDSSTTGVPRAVVLRASDSLTIDVDGTVVEGLEITGSIRVRANDVTIRNSRILMTGPFAIRVEDATGLVVEDTEIDGRGGGDAAVAFGNYTLRRVDVHHVREGPRIAGGNVVIEDSYIHDLVHEKGNHTDAIQIVSGSGIEIRGSRLEAWGSPDRTLANAALMVGNDQGPVDDCLIVGNHLDGGNYTVNAGGGGGDQVSCTFEDNVFGRSARYGPIVGLGPGVVWASTNVWLDTGEPVRSAG